RSVDDQEDPLVEDRGELRLEVLRVEVRRQDAARRADSPLRKPPHVLVDPFDEFDLNDRLHLLDAVSQSATLRINRASVAPEVPLHAPPDRRHEDHQESGGEITVLSSHGRCPRFAVASRLPSDFPYLRHPTWLGVSG